MNSLYFSGRPVVELKEQALQSSITRTFCPCFNPKRLSMRTESSAGSQS